MNQTQATDDIQYTDSPILSPFTRIKQKHSPFTRIKHEQTDDIQYTDSPILSPFTMSLLVSTSTGVCLRTHT